MTTSNLINLQSLFDLSATLNSSDDDGFILNAALLSIMGKLRAFQAAVLLPSDEIAWKISLVKGKKPTEMLLNLAVESLRRLDGKNESENLLIQSGFAFIVPLHYKNSAIALVCLGANISGTLFSEEELQYVSLVAAITANALTNARHFRSLGEAKRSAEQKNQLLGTLFEISREFTALLDKEEVLRHLAYRLMGQMMVSRFALLNKDSSGKLKLTLNRLKITPQTDDMELFSEIFEPINLAQTEDFVLSQKIRKFAGDADAQLFLPMKVQNDVKGLLIVGGKLNKQTFSFEDENFLQALANTAIISLENARLFKEEIEKKRLEEELHIAHQIQAGLLPKELPKLRNFDVAATNISSKQVGGDYFDLIPLGNNEILLVIADVSGKGMPASLLMANTQAALRVLAPLNMPLPAMVARLNDLLYQNTSSDKFVTFFCAKLNTETKLLTYTNAGHNPPIVLHTDGTMDLLTEGGIILGIMENFLPYSEQTITLRNGDVLLLYTDGVSEAMDKNAEEFTEVKLEATLRAYSTEPAQIILSKILMDVQTHSYGMPQSDDITMIVLKCEKN